VARVARAQVRVRAQAVPVAVVRVLVVVVAHAEAGEDGANDVFDIQFIQPIQLTSQRMQWRKP
jgi:hypothetical protein